MWDRDDSQEVGLEAAILERVRNSSLVEWFCADNVVGLKYTADAAATFLVGEGSVVHEVKHECEHVWIVCE